MAGKKEPFPPSLQSNSVSGSSQSSVHPANEMFPPTARNGGVNGVGLTGGGGGLGGSKRFSPVTENARNRLRWMPAHVNAHSCRPSSSPGQLNACIGPERRLRSIVRPLATRLSMALTVPFEVSLPDVGMLACSQSRENAAGGGGPNIPGGGATESGVQAQIGWSAIAHRLCVYLAAIESSPSSKMR